MARRRRRNRRPSPAASSASACPAARSPPDKSSRSVPNRRLVFTWGWEGDALARRRRLDDRRNRAGARRDGTLLRLTHSDLAPPPVAEHHREGWERYLERLRVRAQGDDPGPDSPEMEVVRPCPWLSGRGRLSFSAGGVLAKALPSRPSVAMRRHEVRRVRRRPCPHRSAGEVHRPDVRCVKRRVRAVRAQAKHQVVSDDAAAMLPPDQEREPAEHAAARERRARAPGLADPVGEVSRRRPSSAAVCVTRAEGRPKRAEEFGLARKAGDADDAVAGDGEDHHAVGVVVAVASSSAYAASAGWPLARGGTEPDVGESALQRNGREERCDLPRRRRSEPIRGASS